MAHARLLLRLMPRLALACFLVFFWEGQSVEAQSGTQSSPGDPDASTVSAPDFHKTLLVIGPSRPLDEHAGRALEAARMAALDARYDFQYWAPEGQLGGQLGGRASVSEAKTPSASDLQKRAFEIQLLTQSALMMRPRGLLFLVTDPTLFRPSVRLLAEQKNRVGHVLRPRAEKRRDRSFDSNALFHFGVDFYRTGTLASSILTDQHRPFCLIGRGHDLIDQELCRGFAEKTGAPTLAFGQLGLAAFAEPGLDIQHDETKKYVLFLTSPELLPLLARSPIAYQLQVLVHQTARAQDAETRHWLSQFEGGLVVHSPVWAQTYLGVSSFLLGPRLNVQIAGTHLAQATLREVARENKTP